MWSLETGQSSQSNFVSRSQLKIDMSNTELEISIRKWWQFQAGSRREQIYGPFIIYKSLQLSSVHRPHITNPVSGYVSWQHHGNERGRRWNHTTLEVFCRGKEQEDLVKESYRPGKQFEHDAPRDPMNLWLARNAAVLEYLSTVCQHNPTAFTPWSAIELPVNLQPFISSLNFEWAAVIEKLFCDVPSRDCFFYFLNDEMLFKHCDYLNSHYYQIWNNIYI